MYVSELIGKLQELQKTNGDLPVRLQADHGQSLMSATWAGISYMEADEYIPEQLDEEELPNYPDAITVIQIQAF